MYFLVYITIQFVLRKAPITFRFLRKNKSLSRCFSKAYLALRIHFNTVAPSPNVFITFYHYYCF